MYNYFFRYGLIAKEISEDMGCFDKIGLVDDNAKTTPTVLMYWVLLQI